MMFLIYLFVGFIVQFFVWKKYSIPLFVKMNSRGYSSPDTWLETKEGWIIVVVPLLWPLSLPVIGFWQLLEKIYNKKSK